MFIYILFEIIIFSTLAICIGYIIDTIIPKPNNGESIYMSLLFIYIQIAVDIIVLSTLDKIYKKVTADFPDYYSAISFFNTIFFLVQRQLFYRLINIFHHVDKILPSNFRQHVL